MTGQPIPPSPENLPILQRDMATADTSPGWYRVDADKIAYWSGPVASWGPTQSFASAGKKTAGAAVGGISGVIALVCCGGIVVASIFGGGSAKPSPTATVAPVVATTPEDVLPSDRDPTTQAAASEPPPTVTQGRGDSVINITRNGPKIMKFVCGHCAENTIVEADGSESVLVNTIGPYSGKRWFDIEDTSLTSRLTIRAHGSWTLTVGGFGMATIASGEVSGNGDDVVIDAASTTQAVITNRGSGNFVVEHFSGADGSYGLDVNEIGGYKGIVPLPMPAAIQIISGGSWLIVPGN